VHLWNIPTLPNLDIGELMNDSSDSFTYKDIDAKVALERQDFIHYDPQAMITTDAARERIELARARARRKSKSAVPGAGPPRCVRVVHEFGSAFDYGTYAVDAISVAIYMSNAGWTNLGIFWNVTGRLDTFTEFWATTEYWMPKRKTDARLGTMLEALKVGGAPQSMLSAYSKFPNMSRTLLEPYTVYNSEKRRWQNV
jgi:hypothetical protein